MKNTISKIRNSLKDNYDANEIRSLVSIVIEFVTGLNSTQQLTTVDYAINSHQAEKVDEIIKRLNNFEPVQYIFGQTEFYNISFKLTSDVLIPRPETEELIEWILKNHSNKINLNILDIGTGSGCIAIILAKNLNCNVTALDISEKALSIAKENANANHINNIRFAQSDIFKTESLEQKFDIIVSNPPYVTKTEKKKMNSNVLNYEPHQALFVEDYNPLLFYEKIADIGIKNLKASGSLYFEINENFGIEMIDLLNSKGYQNIELRKDINNKYRMIKGKI